MLAVTGTADEKTQGCNNKATGFKKTKEVLCDPKPRKPEDFSHQM